VGNAVVADIYPIEIRGVAYGVFMMPGVRSSCNRPYVDDTLWHEGGGGHAPL